MKNYEILEHISDLKIRAFGRTKEEVFSNMLLGMCGNQKTKVLPGKVKREIKISSPELSSLLVDFLSEILYLTQVNKEVYSEVNFKKFTDTELKAELVGQKVERFGEDIKGVTYHSLDIHQKKDGTWQAIVLFDI